MTAKRAFDLVVALIGCAVTFPLMLLSGIAIWVDSGLPILFRQERVGMNGRLFWILKFRTMLPGSDAKGKLTTRGDSRVTRIGRVLRQTKLDELPQLVNVVVGDMSLVGPRPEVSEYVELYPPDDRAVVLSVRPGITDNASILFRNESELLDAATDPHECYVNEIMPRKVALYREYVEKRSFWSDIGIIFRTFKVL